MSNDKQFVKIDYLTLEVGDPVYWRHGTSYELFGEVIEFTSTYVYIGSAEYSPQEIEECYTLAKDFYNPRTPKDSAKKTEFPKKILTNEEIYEMLTSDVALFGLSKKAVRKIEKAVLAKIQQGENK